MDLMARSIEVCDGVLTFANTDTMNKLIRNEHTSAMAVSIRT